MRCTPKDAVAASRNQERRRTWRACAEGRGQGRAVGVWAGGRFYQGEVRMGEYGDGEKRRRMRKKRRVEEGEP
jgi:hypothetical protein